jgi:hypothetical protein
LNKTIFVLIYLDIDFWNIRSMLSLFASQRCSVPKRQPELRDQQLREQLQRQMRLQMRQQRRDQP